MVPLKLLEALVNQTASKCATLAKTGANSSEFFTPYSTGRGTSVMGASPCSFLRRRITFSCLVERVKQRQADVKVSFHTFNSRSGSYSRRFTAVFKSIVSCTRVFESETPYHRLVVNDYGNHTFKVESRGVHQGSNAVKMKFGASADDRHVIPCQHVLAAAKRKPLRDGYDMLREYVPASSCVELFVWVVDRY